MLKQRSLRSFFVALCLSIPMLSSADVYTYTDENGVVHVSNKPPKDKNATIIKSKETSKQEAPQPMSNGLGNGVASGALPGALPAAAAPYDPILREASISLGVPLALLRAVCHSESGFNPYAVSSAGAQGLMQLMPVVSTQFGVLDPYDPRDNIFGGARLLKWLLERFGGDLVLTIASYHAGAGAVEKAGGIPPIESTRVYLVMVLSRYYKYKNLP
jgi:soluble lytic murein transglycosylase-like protein